MASWFRQPIEGNKFIDYYKDPEDWLKLVESRPERHAFVATVHGRIVGFADIEFDDDGDVSFAFGVKPEMRGRGFGKRLLDEIIAYTQATGGVDKDNVACRSLLELTGFSPAIDDDGITQYIKQLN